MARTVHRLPRPDIPVIPVPKFQLPDKPQAVETEASSGTIPIAQRRPPVVPITGFLSFLYSQAPGGGTKEGKGKILH